MLLLYVIDVDVASLFGDLVFKDLDFLMIYVFIQFK